MFNVGIVGAGRSAPLVKLTDRVLVWDYDSAAEWDVAGLRFGSDGTLYTFGGWSNDRIIAEIHGEWFASGSTFAIGSNYEIRQTLIAGSEQSAPRSNPIPYGSWMPLADTARMSFAKTEGIPGGGRRLIEIRDTATQTVQASARFWTPGFAP